VAEFHLSSTPEGEDRDRRDGGTRGAGGRPFRPTHLMERVSRVLEDSAAWFGQQHPGRRRGQGVGDHLRHRAAVSDGYVATDPGDRGARLDRSLKPSATSGRCTCRATAAEVQTVSPSPCGRWPTRTPRRRGAPSGPRELPGHPVGAIDHCGEPATSGPHPPLESLHRTHLARWRPDPRQGRGGRLTAPTDRLTSGWCIFLGTAA
jgi:hypothetical protein